MCLGEVVNMSENLIISFSNVLFDRKKYQPKIRSREEMRAVNLCASFSFDSSISEHLVMLKQFLRALLGQKSIRFSFASLGRLILISRHIVPLMLSYLKNSRIYVPGDSRVSLNVQCELLRSQARSLEIDTTMVDETGLHPIVLNWEVDGGEVESIVDFAKALGSQMEASGMGTLVLNRALNGSPEERREWFLTNLSDTYHHAGGVIMGSNPATSCADSNLRLHEASNVYALGACTFPSSGYANTTLTALALTKRLANHLCA